MIALQFYQKTELDINNDIPEVWRKHVLQQRVGLVGDGMNYLIAISVQPDDSSYRYRALMQKPQLVLKFSLPFFFEFPVGTVCQYQNQRFFLARAEDLRKQGSRNIEYTMTLYTNEYYFGVWKLRNIVDPVQGFTEKDNRLKFSYCAKPHEFIDLIVRNLSKKDTSMTWERGECIEASEKTVEFNHTYIDNALNDICNVFETEYEVEYLSTTHAKIHLRRVEYFKDKPVALSYGIGNGFVPGLGRTSEADGVPVKRMLVQGSDRNIDRSTYGAPELLLPISQTIRFDGTHFEGEDGFNASIARTYQSNADGDGVERIDVVSDATKEDSLDCSEIYPSRVGEVTEVRVESAEKNFYDIVDSTIPSDLNFNNYLIAGETMTIIFQDGMLSGKEFDVKYIHEAKDGKPGRRFEIVPQEIDGVTMPNATWCPKKEQTYAVFGIQLPDAYICNNATKTGASWDMMREAVRALYEAEDQKFTFSGTLQALWAKRHWLEVGGYLVVGGHVLFTDEQFAKDGVVIRIVGFKDFLTAPYSPTLELSNSVSAGSSVSSQLRQITNVEVVIEDTEKRVISYTKRRFRDALETLGMLEDARLDGFGASISPVAIQTMALLIGDESLQFKFVGLDNGKYVSRSGLIGYNNDTKTLHCNMVSGGMQIYLQHMTLGQNSITSEQGRANASYKRWKMQSYTSPVLDVPKNSYYLYAKVSSTSTDAVGEFVLSTKSIAMEEVAGYYHLLCGVLNTEIDGERSYVGLNGFTEILPGRITTEELVSTDGKSYLNLEDGSMKLGSCLEYSNDTLKLKFLLSENAELGGWIFRDGKLWSQNGSAYLDGKTGSANLEGIIRLSTTYVSEEAIGSKITPAHLVAISPSSKSINFDLSIGKDQIGKVYRIYNANPFGGAIHSVYGLEFSYGDGFAGGMNGLTYYIRPQEIIEVTCFQTGENTAQWVLTNRYSYQDFKNTAAVGRYPLMLALGRINYNSSNDTISISGVLYNGKSLSSVTTLQKLETGVYKVTFNSGAIPTSFKVFPTGYGSKVYDARVYEITYNSFTVGISDDDTMNNGSCDFMILDNSYWSYETHE